MITNNPWLAGNIESFLFLNCPECTFKTKQKHIFQGHAIENHPLSSELFNESFNPETFDPGHLDISSKYDKTLEEVMFQDDLPLDVGLSYMDETSMTSLLMHNVADSTRPSYKLKTNNQPIKKFLSLAVS